MAADSALRKTKTVIAPATAGTYAYKACIQRAEGAGGTDEICSDVFTVTIAPPDLQFVKVWAEPATVAPGEAFKLYATVSNAGGKSDRTTLWWYSLGTRDTTEKPEELQGTRIDPLPMADGKVTATKHITVTASETPGTYSYRLSIDSVAGEGETDNNYADAVTITVGIPDVVIESMSASETELQWSENEPIYTELSVIVKNIGTARSDNTTLRVFRSANEHISEDDTELSGDIDVEALDPQGEVTLKFSTKVGERAHPTLIEPPTIYYYGALVGSPSNEVNSDNNWSENIVKVTVSEPGILSLSVPPNFISEVAYSKGFTYFLLTAQFLEIRAQHSGDKVDESKYNNRKCLIKLHLPPGFISNQPLDKPAYFMLPVEVPRDKLSNIAEEGARDVLKSVALATFGEILDGVGSIFLSAVTIGWEAGEIIANYIDTQTEAEALTPTVVLEDPEKVQLCFLIVPGRLPNVKISVIQEISVMQEDIELKGDEGSFISWGYYKNTWNLEETWRLENPDVAAAPGAPSMSLTDYPLFQHLPPEVQAYILQYFGETANLKPLNRELGQIPEQTSLLSNYPNPFNPETWIPYQLSEPTDVKLTIYDINGRVVRNIDLGHQRAGVYHGRSRAAYWDGRNAVGEPVASGVYFYTLTAGEFTATRRMLIRK